MNHLVTIRIKTNVKKRGEGFLVFMDSREHYTEYFTKDLSTLFKDELIKELEIYKNEVPNQKHKGG